MQRLTSVLRDCGGLFFAEIEILKFILSFRFLFTETTKYIEAFRWGKKRHLINSRD